MFNITKVVGINLLAFIIVSLAIIFMPDLPEKNVPEPKEDLLSVPIRITEINGRYPSIGYIDHTISGIHYRLFITGNGGMSTVNVTKDSLEILYLKRQ